MPKVTIGARQGLVQSTGGGLILGDGATTTCTGDNAGSTIPVGNPYVVLASGGSTRSGARFANAGTAGEIIVVSVTGNAITFAAESTSLVRGLHGDNDTMEADGTYMFVSDGTRWVFIGGSEATNVAGLTAS